ncbi:hypothetical protein KGM_203114 [Danaus plexippus plexippus]|uniref:Uncharacterized protein n=2 Tax=Danaus plexippus TaxID=13037 RepID=A0A212FHN0_DANPL|nr:hypothetical protein KGM_203114 [Danaus plexippus plexippus]
MLPIYYETEAPVVDKDPVTANINDSQESNVKTIERPFDEGDSKEYMPKYDKGTIQEVKKPCAIVVLSNIQNPSMQSLLRKYRYDSNGMLIPGSVKYFIKLPKGLNSPSVLLPLNDKAFSPLGGFVRYYKEVPPIPQAW